MKWINSIGLIFLVGAMNAYAALGGKIESLPKESKGKVLQRLATTPAKRFSIYEIRSPASVIREYVSPGGVVFALGWEGITHPDLSVHLGEFAKDFAKTQKEMGFRRGMRHSIFETDQVTVERWGHERNHRGRAYCLSLFPPGVSIGEIH